MNCRSLSATLLLLICGAVASAAGATPFDPARPWTFWYWMYGAVSREGIHADLQAMKDAGLGGCYLMPIRGTDDAPDNLPAPTNLPPKGEAKPHPQPLLGAGVGAAQQLTPQFWQMVDYAMQQADSLSLQMGVHICDGFALAGGPWITPEESMQHVVWSDTIVEVGADGLVALPQPAVTGGYYEDIAAFACPVWCDSIAPRVSGTIRRDNNGTFRSKEPGYIQYDFDEPQTVRSLRIVPGGNSLQAQRLLVQASDDGIAWRDIRQLAPPRQGWQNTDQNRPVGTREATSTSVAHYTYTLPHTTSRHFRFCWTPEGTEPGSEDLDAAKWSPVLKIKELTLSAEPRIDQYESKNGSVWRIAERPTPSPSRPTPSPSLEGGEYIVLPLQKETIIVLPLQKETMKLTTPLPHREGPGEGLSLVRVLRFGHASTGHQNATGGGAKGLECDKFSAAAVEKQITRWFGEFKKRPHADVVKYMHVDSWECGSQNWSRNFAEEFRRRRGYDLLPYMPVFAGIPMEGDEQVLRDIRQTINDLLQDVFFHTVARRARDYGVLLSCESVAPTMVSDGMEHYRQADLPMGEFWLNSPTHDKPNDMLDAISGAHVYGKQIVQAEGFTEVRGVWDETPASLKTLLDRNLALGMNRLFFHVFTHNPYMDKKPGMTLDGIGLFFQRDQTWFPEARAFVDYVTRCQRWLHRGWPVVDIAVFTGDEMPRRAWRPEQLADMLPGLIGKERVEAEHKRLRNEGVPMEESPVGVKHTVMANPADWVNALGGYNYDSVNPDVLWNLRAGTEPAPTPALRAGTGSAPTLSGYRALVVPQGTLVSEKSQAKIDSLRRYGMTIIDKPWQTSSLDGLAPDAALPPGIAFCHRRDGDEDIYFLANQLDSVQQFYATFRVHGKGVIVYDPMTDRYTSPIDDIIAADTLTVVRLTMQPRQSLFVLFGTKGITPTVISKWTAALEPDSPQNISGGMRWSLSRKWQLSFRETGRQLKSDTLFSWADHSDADVRYYSGHVRYATTIDYRSRSLQRPVTLSLGDVRDIAHVWLNGHDLGILWLPPYELDITGYLHKGRNTLEIEVVNTWHNALRGLDRGTPPYDGIWTNARYRTKGDHLIPAGLLGPVVLNFHP